MDEKDDLPNMPEGFSGFSWAIAGFCIPILLWPLALLISPNLLKNPHLTDFQSTAMSIFLWLYPFVIGICARIAYRLHQKKRKTAKLFLSCCTLIFWLSTFYVAIIGFN